MLGAMPPESSRQRPRVLSGRQNASGQTDSVRATAARGESQAEKRCRRAPAPPHYLWRSVDIAHLEVARALAALEGSSNPVALHELHRLRNRRSLRADQ